MWPSYEIVWAWESSVHEDEAARVQAEMRDRAHLRSDVMPRGAVAQHGLHPLPDTFDRVFEMSAFVVILRTAGDISMEGQTKIG